MKALYILFAVAAVIISACSVNNEPVDVVNRQITIEAIQEGYDGLTKTAVKDGGKEVYWEPNDEIKVFYSGTGSRFASNNNDLARVAQFTGTLTTIIGFDEGLSESNPLWGLYPYHSEATSDGASVTTILPAEQTGRAGSFAKNTHITLGCSTSLSMGFYSVCGGLRFSLTQEGISSVRFEGLNGEILAGKIRIAFQNGVPSVLDVTEGETTITLIAPNGGAFETGQWYYIEALPGTLVNGFKIYFKQGEKSAVYTKTGSVSIKRSIFGSLAGIDADLTFTEGGDNPGVGNIVFADIIAKYACVDKYDTSGDQEVSYEEAAAVTSLDGLFSQWDTVSSFDEIRYFTNATTIGDAFKGCSNLKSIIIPDNVRYFGSSAFENCSSLESIVLPAHLDIIPSKCFKNCVKLNSVTIPDEVTWIYDEAFCNCSSLEAITIPNSVNYISSYVFKDCVKLKSAHLPSSITVIDSGSFYNCYDLYDVHFPENLKIIMKDAFNGCSFFNPSTSETTITLPPSVTQIYERAFHAGVKNIYFPSNSLITIEPDTFIEGYTKLFVPSNLLDMYKVRKNWKNYSKLIFAIGDSGVINYSISDAIDLGLPSGLKWAQWNIGADAPEESGFYYAWGAIEPDWGHRWSTYVWGTGEEEEKVTKYCFQSNFGSVDNLTTILLEDDAAHIHWGGSWRMPTMDEINELTNQDNCTWSWTSLNSVSGFLVTSKRNENSIFIPAAGVYWWEYINNIGATCFLWSSSLYNDSSTNACGLFVDSQFHFWSGTFNSRCCGWPIRPVCQ